MHNIWEMKSYKQMFETKLHQRNSYVGHLNLSMGWPKLHNYVKLNWLKSQSL